MSDTDKTEPALRAFDPFSLPPAPSGPEPDTAKTDAIGARHGFDVKDPDKTTLEALTGAAAAQKPKPKPKAKPKPKPKKPEVRRMRSRTNVPKAQFNQRVPVHVANGFYDYQRATGLPMGVVLQKAYEALMKADGEGG